MTKLNEETEENKRKIEDGASSPRKKVRTFSVKEFRNQLRSDQKLNALQNFLQQIRNNSDQDCALEYLQKNGSVLEILQCMEQDTTLPPVVVFDIVNELLLKITAKSLNCVDAAYESCRYLLNNFVNAVNKMIGLTSSSKERIVILKLLTAMVAFSSSFSKDILLHVNFNLTNLELITKNTIENKIVRKHFVFFLTTILIDIEYTTLSFLLDKKGMLTSIIPGLQYDDVETVCFMLTAMRKNILENQYVSKTIKMKTFNTIVVKNIVNLYNWKGPNNLKTNKKDTIPQIQIDELQKAKVNECVHEFLLILCTSHKYGVVFRDPLVGMGKKTQNALIYTVLDSMDSPWDHSYASELVIKICASCPDLTKYVWNNLKPALEPRYSKKWMNVVDFTKKLLDQIKPNCLEPYIKNLNIYQINQIITLLVAPLPILKTLIPENNIYELQIIRFKVISLIFAFLSSIQKFMTTCEEILNSDQFNKVKVYLISYIEKNFPSAQVLLNCWDQQDSTENPTGYEPLEYLSLVFDVFKVYADLCPELLDSLKFSHNDLKLMLESFDSFSDAIGKDLLQIKIINLFLHVNPSIFALNSDSFSFFLTFLFRTAHTNVKNVGCCMSVEAARKLLKTTKIFEYGFKREVDVWINGIFNLKHFNESVSVFLSDCIKFADSKAIEYLNNISKYNSLKMSPLFLGVLEYSRSVKVEKTAMNYLNFVIPNLIFHQPENEFFCETLKSFPSNALVDYTSVIFNDNLSFEVPKILRIFGKHAVFNEFNQMLLNENPEFCLEGNEKFALYPDIKLDLLQMGVFYLSRLVELNNTNQKVYSKNLLDYSRKLIESNIKINVEIVSKHSTFIEHFSILDVNNCGEHNCSTNFLKEFIEICSRNGEVHQDSLQLCIKKMCAMIFEFIETPENFGDLISIMKTLRMDATVYFEIISQFSTRISKNLNNYKSNLFHTILIHCLDEYCNFALSSNELQAFPKEIFKNIIIYYISLNESNELNSANLSKSLLLCLKIFPDTVNQIKKNFINSIMSSTEFNKINAELLIFILEKRKEFFHCINENLETLITVKGVLFPILEMLSRCYSENSNKNEIEEIFKAVYVKFENSLHKILRKPQKASQHLDENYHGLCFMIDLNFQQEKFVEYVSKVQKFEVTKTFHVNLISVILRKFLQVKCESKTISNSILTFVHLLVNILKRIPNNEVNSSKTVINVCNCFQDYLNMVSENKFDSSSIQNNESIKLMLKLCLKYGVSQYPNLIEIIKKMIELFRETFNNDVKSIMEMLLSHSEFLDVVLSEVHKCKHGVLSLMLLMCENWPELMTRNHVPILLSSYGATLSEIDKTTLKLLKLHETKTSFYDFKPFLWGPSGAAHYSVRSDIEKALFKQPRMGDVLRILQENIVLSTIKNYHSSYTKNGCNIEQNSIYDLDFFLPLFSHLLAPENLVQTYHFTRSGALSLTIVALSSDVEKVRAAAAHILSRFHYHVEARRSGKDNLLWLRFIEAICKGISVSDELSLNNFASMFLARTALILTQPMHVMYLPLSQYLTAKSTLDFSSIPELYTFLHSSDVNYKDHRNFILEILSDGLVTENDYYIFFRSMSVKLFTELYSSCNCDNEAKLLILDVFISICRLPVGVKFLCSHNSILEFFILDLEDNLVVTSRHNNNISIVTKLVQILFKIISCLDDSFMWGKILISRAFEKISKSEMFTWLNQDVVETLNQLNKLTNINTC